MSDALAVSADEPIAFIDLQAQRRRLGERIDEAIARVLDHGQFIMGPEVGELERRLAAFCGVRHAVTCASGTDGLLLALLARGAGPGDAVVVPAFTFSATAEVVALIGATPVFADVREETFDLDPESLRAAVEVAGARGLRPWGVIAVDLYGQPADYAAIEPAAAGAGLALIADAAQSFGGSDRGRRVGAIGEPAVTSFFPSKPLGCYGDGGAVFTDDDELAEALSSLRVHGQGRHKYDTVRIGLNARLDTIQAAVLIEKLAILEDEIARRQAVAERYSEALADDVAVPTVRPETVSAWAQYTVRLPAGERDRVAAQMREQGVPTAVYYPRALHRQPAYRDFPRAADSLPVAEALADEVLSLPMHPYLVAAAQRRVVEALRAAL